MNTNVLSLKYKPTCNIQYGWCFENDELRDKNIKESMEDALKELDSSEASRWWIRVAIQMHGGASVYVYYRSKTDNERYLVYTEDIDCGK